MRGILHSDLFADERGRLVLRRPGNDDVVDVRVQATRELSRDGNRPLPFWQGRV